jgi:hypothetical protein
VQIVKRGMRYFSICLLLNVQNFDRKQWLEKQLSALHLPQSLTEITEPPRWMRPRPLFSSSGATETRTTVEITNPKSNKLQTKFTQTAATAGIFSVAMHAFLAPL